MENRMYEIFAELGITDYVVTEHPAIFSTEESDQLGLAMEGLNCKNLLIKDKKTERFYQIIIDEHRHADLKHFKEVTGWKKVRFAFPEELMELLGLTPGSVTPLALFNDTEHRITIVLDHQISHAPDDEKISFHPCRNTATLTMRVGDFRRFLDYMGCQVICEGDVV